VARALGRRIIEKAGTPEVELFPKQTDVRGGFGNFVKLPLGLHQKERKWSRILDPDTLDPLSSEAILAVEPATTRLDKDHRSKEEASFEIIDPDSRMCDIKHHIQY